MDFGLHFYSLDVSNCICSTIFECFFNYDCFLCWKYK